MYEILLIIFLTVAVALVMIIMLQQDKGTDMGITFRTNVSGALFGSSGSSHFITRVTSVLAMLFFIISLILGNINNKIDKDNKWKDLNTSAKVEQNQHSVSKRLIEGHGK